MKWSECEIQLELPRYVEFHITGQLQFAETRAISGFAIAEGNGGAALRVSPFSERTGPPRAYVSGVPPPIRPIALGDRQPGPKVTDGRGPRTRRPVRSHFTVSENGRIHDESIPRADSPAFRRGAHRPRARPLAGHRAHVPELRGQPPGPEGVSSPESRVQLRRPRRRPARGSLSLRTRRAPRPPLSPCGRLVAPPERTWDPACRELPFCTPGGRDREVSRLRHPREPVWGALLGACRVGPARRPLRPLDSDIAWTDGSSGLYEPFVARNRPGRMATSRMVERSGLRTSRV